MDKEITSGNIGTEAGYKVELHGGIVRISIDYGGAQAKAGMFIEVGLIELLQIAAKQSTNTVDDSLVEMVKLALGA